MGMGHMHMLRIAGPKNKHAGQSRLIDEGFDCRVVTKWGVSAAFEAMLCRV